VVNKVTLGKGVSLHASYFFPLKCHSSSVLYYCPFVFHQCNSLDTDKVCQWITNHGIEMNFTYAVLFYTWQTGSFCLLQLLETASCLPFLPRYKAKKKLGGGVHLMTGVNVIFQDCRQAVLVAKMTIIISSGDRINLWNFIICILKLLHSALDWSEQQSFVLVLEEPKFPWKISHHFYPFGRLAVTYFVRYIVLLPLTVPTGFQR